MLDDLFRLGSLTQIAILTAAYYFILSSIRGTRGAVLLKGLIVFFVVAFGGIWWLAVQLKFDAIQQILSWLLSASSIAAIVIFAPELRRALLRLAQSPPFSPFIRELPSTVIDEIVDAAFRLSKNRVGALVAIQRDVGLGEYIEKGVRVDALVSNELLESIFHPGNPLHDGAVIVQHDRVAAAASFLPLSEEEVSRSLGTRHRAALGLCEETDAVVLIVSEETGRVSLCVDRKITSDLTREALEQALRELTTRGGRPGPYLRARRGAAGPVLKSGEPHPPAHVPGAADAPVAAAPKSDPIGGEEKAR